MECPPGRQKTRSANNKASSSEQQLCISIVLSVWMLFDSGFSGLQFAIAAQCVKIPTETQALSPELFGVMEARTGGLPGFTLPAVRKDYGGQSGIK